MSQLYNGTQDFNPDLLETAAKALNAEMWELLMLPERAMAIRRLRESAAQIVHSEPPATNEGSSGTRKSA